MAGVLQSPVRAPYLAGYEARDVSTITGIPWYFGRTESRGRPHPMISLLELEWWDRWRVAWTLVAAYAYLESLGHERRALALQRAEDYAVGVWSY